MKILHVTNAHIGGAWVAAHRLHVALREAGVDSRMLVRTKGSDDPFVSEVGTGEVRFADFTCQGVQGSEGRGQRSEGRGQRVRHSLGEDGRAEVRSRFQRFKRLQRARRAFERLPVRGRGWLGAKLTKALGMEGCSLNIFPTGLHRVLNASDADVIHLHWINNEMISIKEIAKIKKPIVWTLHDCWPLLGAEHHSDAKYWQIDHQKHEKSQKKRGAREHTEESLDRINGIGGIGGEVQHEKHEKGRGEASAQNPAPRTQHPVTRTTLYNAVNNWTFKKKKKAWRNLKVSFIAPSTWMAEQVKKSQLFCNSPVTVIPNCLDLEVFKPMDQMQCRKKLGLPLEKKLILFGAHNPLEPNKGLDLLEEALHKLPEEVRGGMGVVVFGSKGARKIGGLETVWLGSVPGEAAMAEVYNAVDMTCVPSRIETLPTVIAESLSCGIPCVGFRVGGIPDMIEHHVTGWLAEPYSAGNLAEGILWGLRKNGGEMASRNMVAGRKATDNVNVAGDEAMATTCRRKAEQLISSEDVALKHASVYKALGR